jgi:DNA-directed RNA polymerase specialized sigma24 family protein
MTSLPSDDWPADADELAAIARDGSRPEVERNQALAQLLPTIRRVAQRVAARFAGMWSEEVMDEAPGRVCLALDGYEPGNSFEAWCYGVLRNHVRSELRRHHRERARLGNVAGVAQAVDLQRALQRALDQQNNLSEADLDLVRGWRVAQRLAVMALTGLWRHVPDSIWANWLQEFSTVHQRELPDPFPPVLLGEYDSLAERNAILCEAMNVSRNTLSVWLYRCKPILSELQYVRDLMDNT